MPKELVFMCSTHSECLSNLNVHTDYLGGFVRMWILIQDVSSRPWDLGPGDGETTGPHSEEQDPKGIVMVNFMCQFDWVPQGNQRLFWMPLSGCFWVKLTCRLIDWGKQTVLHSMGEPHPVGWRLEWNKASSSPNKENVPVWWSSDWDIRSSWFYSDL